MQEHRAPESTNTLLNPSSSHTPSFNTLLPQLTSLLCKTCSNAMGTYWSLQCFIDCWAQGPQEKRKNMTRMGEISWPAKPLCLWKQEHGGAKSLFSEVMLGFLATVICSFCSGAGIQNEGISEYSSWSSAGACPTRSRTGLLWQRHAVLCSPRGV